MFTRAEVIRHMKSIYPTWSKEDIENELNSWTEDDIKRGYAIFDYDGTGILCIEKIDCMQMFETDEEASLQAAKEGIPIIPINELPCNFGMRWFGWIDSKENRKAIQEYCNN